MLYTMQHYDCICRDATHICPPIYMFTPTRLARAGKRRPRHAWSERGSNLGGASFCNEWSQIGDRDQIGDRMLIFPICWLNQLPIICRGRVIPWIQREFRNFNKISLFLCSARGRTASALARGLLLLTAMDMHALIHHILPPFAARIRLLEPS
jgi:hypothetical protein